jgi:hypothetical protein
MPGKDLVPLTPAPPAAPVVPWPQQAESKTEFVLWPAARWARRNSHASVPLAIPPALWLAALGLRLGHAIPYALACGALLAACVWFFAPHKWDRAAEQWYARLSAVLGAGWLVTAAWLGPVNGMPGIILASVLVAGCGAWGFFWWRHKRPRGQKRQERLVAACDAWWVSYCHLWNLHASHVIEADLRGVTLRIRVKGIQGRHTLLHFRQAVPGIESAAEGQADIGMVRVEPVKGKPSQVDIFLKQQNPLREPVEYDMDLAPRSVHDLAPAGRKETGSWKMASLRRNRFTIGETRSGKSNDLLVGIANLSGCPDARIVLIDLKGGRSARPVLKSGAAEYVVIERDEARMTLRMLVAEARAREMYAYDGNEQLIASVDTPALFTMVDETHELTATEDGAGDPESRRHVSTLASQGSGVEEYEWIYTQHGSLESSVGTEQIRANLGWRTCYRVAEARHGAYVIPEYNRLDASRLEEKGTCYMKDGPDVTPEQVRAPHMPHELLTRIATQNAALLGPRAPLVLWCGKQAAFEVITGRDEDGQEIKRTVTWQEWWDTRWLRLHPAFRADSPQYRAAAAAYPDLAAEVTEIRQAPASRSSEPAAASTAAGSLPGSFTPDPRLVGQLPAELASQEDRFCAALQAATAGSPITPKDLMTASGRAKSWVHDRLGALAETGQVTQVSRGQYAALPGSDIRAGLGEIKARTDRLNREAREMVNAA